MGTGSSMNESLARNLTRMRLVEADTSTARVVTIYGGEPLTAMAQAAYNNGWILREVNAAGTMVAAYQLPRRHAYRTRSHNSSS
jgi:hypothetical protein